MQQFSGFLFILLAVPFVAPQCLTENDVVTRPNPEFLSSLQAGQLDFSIDLFKELEKEEGIRNPGKEENLFFSPESVYQAMLMAFFGSEGETEEELRKVLHLGDASKMDVMVARSFNLLSMNLRGLNKSYELDIANRLYFEQTQEVRECTKDLFSDEIEYVDFLSNAEQVRLQINSWVETKTKGKIQDLIPPGHLDSRTLLALVNSAYFKGQWITRFEPENTSLETFYISFTDYAQVNMMNVTSNFQYIPSEELQAHVLALPYKGDDISMIILLPPFIENGEKEILRRLDGPTLRNVLRQLHVTEMDEINVLLPKFKLEEKFDLKQTLVDLGAATMFDPDRANMSTFTATPGVSFSAAIHKAFVEVNEEGTEAAAATALFLSRSARARTEKIICNHPFIFLIYDHVSNSILFSGIYRNPKS